MTIRPGKHERDRGRKRERGRGRGGGGGGADRDRYRSRQRETETDRYQGQGKTRNRISNAYTCGNIETGQLHDHSERIKATKEEKVVSTPSSHAKKINKVDLGCPERERTNERFFY